MAPKFLRNIRKKVQKFFEKRVSYNKIAHDDEEWNDDFASAVRVDPLASPELDLTLATPAYEESFEADFSVFDRDTNYSGTYPADSCYETAGGNEDPDWFEPRCPSRNLIMSPDIINYRSRNSELGSIVLSATKDVGLAVELGKTRIYRAWEDVLLMDPQKSREWLGPLGLELSVGRWQQEFRKDVFVCPPPPRLFDLESDENST